MSIISKLESYMIYSSAQEGLLFSNMESESINKLAEKKALFIFTSSDNIKHQLSYLVKLKQRYQFNDIISLNIDEYVKYRILSKRISIKTNALTSILDMEVPANRDQLLSDLIGDIIYVCDKYCEAFNSLVALYTTDTYNYTYPMVREHPVLISNISMTERFFDNPNPKEVYLKDKEFKRLNSKISKSLFINLKDFNKSLYHISRIKNINILEPRITNKPLKFENLRIPRISAATDIDSCCRALGFDRTEESLYYIYKLLINDKSVIVKPDIKLVPDIDKNNEYWVLTPTIVECIGEILINYDSQLDKFNFKTKMY